MSGAQIAPKGVRGGDGKIKRQLGDIGKPGKIFPTLFHPKKNPGKVEPRLESTRGGVALIKRVRKLA